MPAEELKSCPFCGSKDHFKQAHRIYVLVPDTPVAHLLESQVNDLIYEDMIIKVWYDEDKRCRVIVLAHPSFDVLGPYGTPWAYGAESFIEKFKKFEKESDNE
jgi:hypothetical protein